jgi:hypothetical protein
VADELVEFLHAKQRGYQLRSLRRGSGRYPRERIDAVSLDEAELESVGVGDDGDLLVLVVGRAQDWRLEAADVQIGKVGAPVNPLGLGLLDSRPNSKPSQKLVLPLPLGP